MRAAPGGSGGDGRGRGAPPGRGERGGPRARPRGSALREAAPLCPPAVPRPRPVAALRGPPGAKPSRLESRRVFIARVPSQENPHQEGRGLAAGLPAQPGPGARAQDAPLPPPQPPGRPAGRLYLSPCPLQTRAEAQKSGEVAVAVWASLLDKSPAPSGFFKIAFLGRAQSGVAFWAVK